MVDRATGGGASPAPGYRHRRASHAVDGPRARRADPRSCGMVEASRRRGVSYGRQRTTSAVVGISLCIILRAPFDSGACMGKTPR